MAREALTPGSSHHLDFIHVIVSSTTSEFLARRRQIQIWNHYAKTQERQLQIISGNRKEILMK
jgi:hypothetical protein